MDILDEAEDWTRDLDNYDLDTCIVEMEAAQIIKRYNKGHAASDTILSGMVG